MQIGCKPTICGNVPSSIKPAPWCFDKCRRHAWSVTQGRKVICRVSLLTLSSVLVKRASIFNASEVIPWATDNPNETRTREIVGLSSLMGATSNNGRINSCTHYALQLQHWCTATPKDWQLSARIFTPPMASTASVYQQVTTH